MKVTPEIMEASRAAHGAFTTVDVVETELRTDRAIRKAGGRIRIFRRIDPPRHYALTRPATFVEVEK